MWWAALPGAWKHFPGAGQPESGRRARPRTWLKPHVPSLVSLLNSCAPERQTDLSAAPSAGWTGGRQQNGAC